MLIRESKVKIVDNTWGKTAKIIGIIKWSFAGYATVWDIVVVAVKDASTSGQVEKWSVHRAVVVRTRKEVTRKNWTAIRSDDNAVVLIDEDKNPKWKRIFWPVFSELRLKWFKQLTTMADETI